MAYVKRTIEIHYDSDKLVFNGNTREESALADKQYDALMEALGYMVWYGMSGAICDSKVSGSLTVGKGMDDVEVCFNYRDADAPPEKQGFTMAAVSRENGTKYTTHS
jgi:hypothetical protein